MSLGEFSQRQRQPRKSVTANKPSGPAKPGNYWKSLDPDKCPDGADADLWHLMLTFQQYAVKYGIELRAGRPVIYAEFKRLADTRKMRAASFTQETYKCRGRALVYSRSRKPCFDLAEFCWMHWPPDDPDAQRPGRVTWAQKFEVIMAEFWSRLWDQYALDAFVQHFNEYGNAILKHWDSLRAIKAIDAQPKTDAPAWQRYKPGGTIADEHEEE